MSLHNLNWTVEFYEKNLNECNSFLKSLKNYNEIPSINYIPLQSLRDGTLVQYRGMVQDMLNPEYYSPFYTVINTSRNESYEKSGKFRDVPCCQADEEFKDNEREPVPKERQVFFCVPIPGSNDWVETQHSKKDIKNQSEIEQSSGLNKRTSSECREDDTQMEVCNETNTLQQETTSPSTTKKSRTEEGNHMPEENNGQSTSPTVCNLANYFPFGKESGVPCIIKVYEDDEKYNLILNNGIEVIGFLSLNPALEANWEGTDLEDKAIHPPPSLVPRIHAIFIRKLFHCNPLLDQIVPYDNISELAEIARSDLKLIFTQLLFEDTVAADFLLCHLLSKVYVRAEGHAIGKLSLNFYNIKQKNFGMYLYDIIKKLVTKSHYLPLSIELFNESTFVPKKDYETNRLWSGFLQLTDHTHLILDETKMNEGRLNNQGCLNVLALQRLFRDQEIQYDFGYYPVTYSTNIPLLVLSEGKSMFEADVKFNIKSDSTSESALKESYEAVKVYLNDEVLNKLRIYFTSIRLMDFELGEEMVKKIGEDYVCMRQSNEKVNSEDLHTLLVLSRLLALSHGRKSLTLEDWSRALEMETERKSRLTG